MEDIGRAVRPRIVSIPRLTDAELAGLGIPILAVLGGRDVLLDSSDTQARLKRTASQAEICFLPGGYHFLPDQTARVMAFLERSALAGDRLAIDPRS